MFFDDRLYFSSSLFSLIFTLFCISLTFFQMFFVFFLLKLFAVTIQEIDGKADKKCVPNYAVREVYHFAHGVGRVVGALGFEAGFEGSMLN